MAQPAVQHMAQAATQAFNIPPQPLSEALIQFGRQSGLQVSAESGVVRDMRTAGVSGAMTRDQALTALLAGTGLTYRITGSMVAIERPGATSGAVQLDPVRVQAGVPPQAMIDNIPPPYAGGQVASGGQLGFLGNRAVMDTPFNQTSYTAKVVEDQQARTVGEVLANDPSVRATRPAFGGSSELFNIRGFSFDTAAMQYGGLYGVLPYLVVDAAIGERIEVLKGPSAMLNGLPPFNVIGGTVNLVPKRAGDEPLTRGIVNYYSVGQVGGQIDFSRRFGPDDEVGIRINGVYRDGETAIRWNSEDMALGLVGLDFRGDRLRLSADLGIQNQNIDGVVVEQTYLAAGVSVPAPPKASIGYAQPWGSTWRQDLFGAVRGEFDITDRMTVYASFGVSDFRWQALQPGDATVQNVSGSIAQDPIAFSIFRTSQTAQVGVRGSVDTGPFNHAFNVSAAGLWQQNGAAYQFGATIQSNIYHPIYVPQPNFDNINSVPKTDDTTFISIALADTISAADDRIQLTLGARQQYVGQNSYDVQGVLAQSYYEGALSPSAALLFKPWKNVSVYGNWIQGLQQGTIVQPPFANAGEVFPPYKSTQFEAGVKVDWGRFTTTVDVFQISRPSILVDVPTNTLVLSGEQRNQGLEVNFFGEPMAGIRLLGGGMFLNAVLTKTQGGLTDGWQAPNSPNFQFNLGAEWDTPFVQGLTLNGRVVYTGAQYIDTLYPRRSIADWTTLDLGVRYRFDNPAAHGKPLIVRFDVGNVLGTNYWASASPLFLGPPRTFRMSLAADF